VGSRFQERSRAQAASGAAFYMWAAVAGLLILAILAAACNGSTVTPSASPSVVASASPVGGVVGPGLTLGPDATIWPLDIIDGTIALAAMDNEIKKAGQDLITAADTQDLVMMLGAAQGLSDLATQGLASAQRLSTWQSTQAVGKSYLDVLTSIKTAADRLATAIQQQDAAGIGSSAQALGLAIETYRGVRGQIVELANFALTMRHMLVK
jgi:hypothetical protein